MHDDPNTPRLDQVNARLSRRGFLGAGAAAGTGLLLSACGGGKSAGESTGAGTSGTKFTGTYKGPTVSIAYWNGFTGGDGPFMRALVQKFNATHKNIKVAMNTIQWADYYQKVPAAVVARKGPDVGIMHVEQLSTFAATKVIQPLDDVVSELKLNESDFIPLIWKAGVYQGKRYGIPLDVHSLAQYYNTDLLKKAGIASLPESNPEFDKALDTMVSKGVKNPFWMPVKWPAHLMFLSLLWQFGGEPYAADGSKATFDSAAGQQALAWMVSQVKNGHSPRNVAIDTQYTAFKNGRDAVTWDGIWQINDLKSTASNLKWGLSFIPKIGNERLSWSSSHQFVLYPSTDKNKANAAKTFIAWISSQSAAWAGAGMIPARNSERQGATFAARPQAKIASNLDGLRFLPQIAGIGDVQSQTLEVAVNKAVLGQQDPKSALSQAAKQATKLMQANKKKFGG
jgi:multiple sugar transport system substrate-binding protein